MVCRDDATVPLSVGRPYYTTYDTPYEAEYFWYEFLHGKPFAEINKPDWESKGEGPQ